MTTNKPLFRFNARAVESDPTGYYMTRWDRAQHDGDRSQAGMWMVYYDSPDPSDWPAIKIERVGHGAS